MHSGLLVQSNNTDTTFERCLVCKRGFKHEAFIDHLFASKDCMRKYWEEEEKTHAIRMRHRNKLNLLKEEKTRN